MTHRIAIKIETINEERRNLLFQRLIELLDNTMNGVDTATLAYQQTTKYGRWTDERKKTLVWEAGEVTPLLAEFGIIGAQLDMFNHAQPLGEGDVAIMQRDPQNPEGEGDDQAEPLTTIEALEHQADAAEEAAEPDDAGELILPPTPSQDEPNTDDADRLLLDFFEPKQPDEDTTEDTTE